MTKFFSKIAVLKKYNQIFVLHTKERKNEGEANSGEDEYCSQKNIEPVTVRDPRGKQLLYASRQRIHQQGVCAQY